MADNVAITAGAGTTIRTDDVGGVQYQYVKLDGGGDGVSIPLIASATVPVPNTGALPVREVGQKVFSVGFGGAIAAGIDANFTELRVGTGVSRSQASSNLIVTSGTTANAEYLARSTTTFTGAMLARYRITLGARNVNTNFNYILADRIGETLTYSNSTNSVSVTLTAHGFTSADVGKFMFVGGITASSGTAVPGRYPIASITDANTFVLTGTGWVTGAGTLCLFGLSYARLLYSGAQATTNASFDVGNKGWSDAQQTINVQNSGTPGHIAQIHLDGRNAYVSDMLVASTTTPVVALRGSRVEFVPDDSTALYLYLWSYNGTTAPTSTVWTTGSVNVEQMSAATVYVAGQKQQGTAAPAPVTVTGALPTGAATIGAVNANVQAGSNLFGDVGIEYRTNAIGTATNRHIVATASTNATSVKAGVGRVIGWTFGNTTTAWKYVKLHNTASAPTAGTGVALTVAVPPNGVAQMVVEGGIGFGTGIGFTITNLSADADTTVVAAGDVVGELFFA